MASLVQYMLIIQYTENVVKGVIDMQSLRERAKQHGINVCLTMGHKKPLTVTFEDGNKRTRCEDCNLSVLIRHHELVESYRAAGD